MPIRAMADLGDQNACDRSGTVSDRAAPLRRNHAIPTLDRQSPEAVARVRSRHLETNAVARPRRIALMTPRKLQPCTRTMTGCRCAPSSLCSVWGP